MNWLESQIPFILSLQEIGALKMFMRLITLLGNEEFFLLMIPLVYLCVNRHVGAKLGLIVILCDALNSLLKMAFHQPRPYWTDTRVQPLSTDTSYGLPSSHAQNAAAIWFFLARERGKKPLYFLAALLVALIALSRIYLGVHFPTDVLGGMLIGFAFLWTFLRLYPRAAQRYSGQRLAGQIAISFGAALLLVMLGLIVRALPLGEAATAAWAPMASDAGSLKAIVGRAGALCGLGIGLALMQRHARFRADGPLGLRVARFVLGLVGVLICWRGLAMVFPKNPENVELFFRFARYALLTFWVSFGAPLLFLKTGLAARDER
ncbi:MAG TPA: phosphatase PAP2 family protein [Abditibacteriaceae bacterium]|jgi:membrane-associated phospholipid phosphatase